MNNGIGGAFLRGIRAENSTYLNQFFQVTIAAKIGKAKTRKYFGEHSQLVDIDVVSAILDNVPDQFSSGST